MNDPGLNNLLKWGIENSAASRNDPNAPPPTTQFDVKAMNDFLNGPRPLSDPQVMEMSMKRIKDKDLKPGEIVPMEEKIELLENFADLVEQIDNANNLEPLGLWSDLLEELHNEEPQMRKHAARSIGAAVQNNIRGQQRLLILNAVPTLLKLGTEDESQDVRLMAILALSRFSRNFQPGFDAVLEHLPAQFKPKGKLDAGDMADVDSIIEPLRTEAKKKA